MTVWRLRQSWDRKLPTHERLALFAKEIEALPNVGAAIREVGADAPKRRYGIAEKQRVFELDFEDALSF
jgi:hypothetical protein